MKNLFFILILPFLCNSQADKLQSIGSLQTYVILCPCKLFKHYEDRKLFYFCEDEATNIEYHIEEFKHKDGIDIILNTVSQNISAKKKSQFDSTIELDKQKALDDYLKVNPNGINVDFMDGGAIIVNGERERKIFFSDEQFIVSYEIKVTGKNSDSIDVFFNKSINSLALKGPNHIVK